MRNICKLACRIAVPCLAAALLTACAAPATSPPSPTPAAPNADLLSTEPWSYNGKPGAIITTPHYRVYTTNLHGALTLRLPLFLETALAHYRTAITGDAHPLPAPPVAMDTYILANRPDWALLTKQLLADQSATFLKIQRGGFAYGGRALLFDVGTHDTLAIASHEGWHQYTQRTFATPLPIWLEEGMATYMEGHRWGGPTGADPHFLPWANVERFDQLRQSAAKHKLLALRDLLNASPQYLIASDQQAGLVYYAQVWALTHFLDEGAGGKYHAKLATLLADAAAGKSPAIVAQALANDPTQATLDGRALHIGPAVFLAYFNPNLDEAAHEYAAFMQKLVQPGSRGPIVAGKSPFLSNSTSE